MGKSLYHHTETGVETELDDNFARVFGDTLIRVDSKKSPGRPKKSEDTEATETDSSEEGNN
jgi:hypothetical protein